MTETRRTFLRKLGMLGALALISPTGAIEAIVPKEPKSPLNQGELGIIERFTMHCHKQPPGHVGRSVCGVETMISETTFSRLVRGLSVGRDKRSMKYFNCMLDDNLTLSGKEFERFCKDALRQIELAWRHDRRAKGSKPWGTAPPTMTQKEAHKLVYRKL